MCFGSRSNPEIPNGTTPDVPVRTLTLRSLEKDNENKNEHLPAQWGWKGALANTPQARSKAVQKSLTEQRKKDACPS